VPTPLKEIGANKDLETKKQNANKGRPTCHGDFVKKILEEQKEAAQAFKDANKEMKGAHLIFVANYKKEHAEDFTAFEAAWKEAHPKAEAAPKSSAKEDDMATVASEPSGSDDLTKMNGQELRDIYHAFQGKPAGLPHSQPYAGASTKPLLITAILAQRAGTWVAPKTHVISDEQKAKMKAGREAAKVKKEVDAARVVAVSMMAELMGHGEVPDEIATLAATPDQKLKKRGPKKLEDMTAEERAKHNAKKAERQAKKAADALAGKPTVDTDSASDASAPSVPSARSTSPKLKDD